MILTYKFRIKDSISRKYLNGFARNVNLVWNYLNDLNKKNYLQGVRAIHNSIYLSDFDMDKYLSGSSKLLNLHSQTIQSISATYFSNRKTFKKSYLSWRSYKRSLGWIPMKASGFHLDQINSTISYQKKILKYYNSRKIPEGAEIKTGSFNQDSRGRWFVTITFEIDAPEEHQFPNNKIGIDLGVKEVMTLSDGTKFHRANCTKIYEDKLAVMQRAKKKKQVKKLHDKIKNSRKDHYHKITSKIAKQFSLVVVGDVTSQDIVSKNLKGLSKGVYDASWYFIRTLLKYKAVKLGGECEEVSEEYSTQNCSTCGARSGPRGQKGLSIRSWICSKCHAEHDRDINSAKNILIKYVSKTLLVLPYRTL